MHKICKPSADFVLFYMAERKSFFDIFIPKLQNHIPKKLLLPPVGAFPLNSRKCLLYNGSSKGERKMRRGILLVVGLGGCLALLLTLGMTVAAGYPQPSEMPQTDACAVAGTPLEVLSLVSYDGAFWEDGSDREVVEIAALLVENRSDCFVEEGAVVLDWQTDRFVFEFTWLPPHSRLLVLESSAKSYFLPEAYSTYGWTQLRDPSQSAAQVSAEGMTILLQNPTGCTLPAVTVRYKHYHPESSTYIGGITYSASAWELRPGESRLICPAHFSTLGSCIVCAEEPYSP